MQLMIIHSILMTVCRLQTQWYTFRRPIYYAATKTEAILSVIVPAQLSRAMFCTPYRIVGVTHVAWIASNTLNQLGTMSFFAKKGLLFLFRLSALLCTRIGLQQYTLILQSANIPLNVIKVRAVDVGYVSIFKQRKQLSFLKCLSKWHQYLFFVDPIEQTQVCYLDIAIIILDACHIHIVGQQCYQFRIN